MQTPSDKTESLPTAPETDRPHPALTQVARIREIIADFHYALDQRENGGTAGWRALLAIREALGIEYVQGVEEAKRRGGK